MRRMIVMCVVMSTMCGCVRIIKAMQSPPPAQAIVQSPAPAPVAPPVPVVVPTIPSTGVPALDAALPLIQNAAQHPTAENILAAGTSVAQGVQSNTTPGTPANNYANWALIALAIGGWVAQNIHQQHKSAQVTQAIIASTTVAPTPTPTTK